MAHTPSADAARARFEAATAAHLTGPLTDQIALASVDAATWEQHNQALWDGATDRAPACDLRQVMTDDERAHGADLEATLTPTLSHRVLLRAGAEVVGAFWGTQETWQRYYMVYSVVRRDWQGRGVYKALLARVLAAASASGFREIYSRHLADNNAVLVPKLKAGFTISGFEINARFGVLVHLRYFPGAGMRALAAHRVDGSHAAALRARGLPIG
ncbi:MAG: GNAT family N-acetyltransferase [Myxococcales bacterium]|nr:GNAT family N-acetyltransferase [Myxococcales bacterium]